MTADTNFQYFFHDDEPPLAVQRERTVFREQNGAHFTVTAADVVVRKTGEALTLHVAQVKDGIPGAVCVAMHHGKLLLARHWRISTNAWEWEFPRGMGEPGETPEQTAIRELYEETGLQATQAHILQTIHADTGLIRDTINIAEIPVAVGNTSETSDWELSHQVWLPPEQLETMISTGAITDGITISAYAIWRLAQS